MKKIIITATILVLLASSLQGCGRKPDTPNSKTHAGIAGQKTTLTVLAGQSTSDAGIEDMINDVLEARFPDITLEWECVDWGEKFAPQMAAKFAAGEVPDIMIGKAQDVATYVPSGNLAVLDGSYVNYVLDASLPAVTVGKKLYGLSYNAVYQGVMYNKDIFKMYGVKVPATQTELKQAVEKFKMVHVTPFASHFQEIWYIGNMTMQFAMNDVFNKYPDWGDRLRNGSTSFEDSAEYRSCFEYNRGILDSTWSDTFAISQSDCDMRFAQGEAAMYVTGSWSLQLINEINPDMNVGIFPFPNQSGDSELIFEPNITFMKSARTDFGDAVDKVFETIFSGKDLAVEIYNFTKTASMLKDVNPTFPNLIQSDIDYYVKSGMVTDVTIGNTQLIWAFQEDYSRQLYSWLQGKASLDDVLVYADKNKNNSISKAY